MMVLYHLHNPTAPAFVTTCNICHLDIETGQGWRCEVCPDYDVCNACYQKDGGIDHPHKLTNHPSMADRDAQNKEARQLRVLQVIFTPVQCDYGIFPYIFYASLPHEMLMRKYGKIHLLDVNFKLKV